MKVTMNKREVPAEGRKSLSRAVKNVKEILQTKKEDIKPPKVDKALKKKRKNRKQNELGRGIVYVGRVPHGFYEDQMKEFFKQFGSVSRIRIARSKLSGKSRGYAYVEFVKPDVAKIAADTMNNYLMCGRLIKTTYIPPEKQHSGYFNKLHWTKEHFPKKLNRINEKKIYNAPESTNEHEVYVKKSMKRLDQLSKKLKIHGIDLDFAKSFEN